MQIPGRAGLGLNVAVCLQSHVGPALSALCCLGMVAKHACDSKQVYQHGDEWRPGYGQVTPFT